MSLQVKIVGDFCNLRCSYCRNRDFNQAEKVVMSIETLEKLIDFHSSLPQKKIRVHWHGGEPLLAGKDFFRQIVMLEKNYPNKEWLNVVQTNATLVDNQWAKFFSENNFQIGVSIDGSERAHNIDRIATTGRGTYQLAMRGVNTLRSNGLHPGAICTVTRKTVVYAEEIFSELVSAGFKSIAFNAFFNTASSRKEDEYGLTDKDWFSFLKEIFELWLAANDETIRVRELDAILAWTIGKSTNDCSFRGACSQWFAIDKDGGIYPCERFGYSTYFGNIDTIGGYPGLISSQPFQKWRSTTNVLPSKCKTCDFLSLCNNGCRSQVQADNQDAPLYVYCESRLEFFRYIKRRLSKEEL